MVVEPGSTSCHLRYLVISRYSKHIIIVFHEGSNYMVFVDECVGRISDNLVTGTWLGNHLFCLGRIHLILDLPCSESHKWQEH